MPAKLRIPASLRAFADGASVVEVEATTVDELLGLLRANHAELSEQILDHRGEFLGFIQLYVDGRSTRDPNFDGAIPPHCELLLVAPVAGG